MSFDPFWLPEFYNSSLYLAWASHTQNQVIDREVPLNKSLFVITRQHILRFLRNTENWNSLQAYLVWLHQTKKKLYSIESKSRDNDLRHQLSDLISWLRRIDSLACFVQNKILGHLASLTFSRNLISRICKRETRGNSLTFILYQPFKRDLSRASIEISEG